MIALVQRVNRASVTVEEHTVGNIAAGMLILLCVVTDDTEQDLHYTLRKCAALRIFDDSQGVMNKSVTDINGEILVISQFTLAAAVRRGNRPSYIAAAPPQKALPMYEEFCRRLREDTSLKVEQGLFGADMKVSLTNDGPVTIIINSREK